MNKENQGYVDSLNFEVFDIVKELNDKRNFAMTITSKRRTGKSVLLKNLCYFIKDWYEDAYVFSQSAHLQKDLFNFVKKENIIDGFNEEKLKEIWDFQATRIEKMKNSNVPTKDLPKILILFDDIVGDNRVRHSKVLNDFFILGRHLQFAQIIITQCMGGKYGLPAVVRQNVDCAVSFFLDAEYCRDLFCSQYLSTKNKRTGLLIYEKITRDVPFQAIIVLNCKVDRDPLNVVKTFVAKEKIPKFMLGKKVGIRDKSIVAFVNSVQPSAGITQNFLPPFSKNEKVFKMI